MSYPPTLTTRTVKGRFVTHPDGSPAKGRVRIALSNFLQGPTDDAFVVNFDETFRLDSNGAFSTVLPATNDPQWTSAYYKIHIMIDDRPVERSRFEVPYNATGPLDLADILNLPPSTPGQSYILSSAIGAPGGVASLDSTGLVPQNQLPTTIAAEVDWDDVLNKPTAYPHDEVTWNQVTGKPGSFPPSTHQHAITDVTGLSAELSSKPDLDEIEDLLDGKADVVHTHVTSDITDLAASLDDKADLVNGVIPTEQIPAIAVVDFLGHVANQNAMLALTGQKGDWCIRDDQGNSWVITGSNPSQLSSWTALPVANVPVQSVNGQTGVVVLGKNDINLGNVDNTSDANKPVSFAVSFELNKKVNATGSVRYVADYIPGNVDPTSTNCYAYIAQAVTDAGIGGKIVFNGRFRCDQEIQLLNYQLVSGHIDWLGAGSGVQSSSVDFRQLVENSVDGNSRVGFRLAAQNLFEHLMIAGPGLDVAGTKGVAPPSGSEYSPRFYRVSFYGWEYGTDLLGAYYSDFIDCSWQLNKTAVRANACYNLSFYKPRMRCSNVDLTSFGTGVEIVGFVRGLKVIGGSIENYTTAIKGANQSDISIIGTYFEMHATPSGAFSGATAVDINAKSSTTLAVRDCTVYLHRHLSFIDGRNASNSTLVGQANQFIYADMGLNPAPTVPFAYNILSSLGDVKLGPDNWRNVFYDAVRQVSGYTPNIWGSGALLDYEVTFPRGDQLGRDANHYFGRNVVLPPNKTIAAADIIVPTTTKSAAYTLTASDNIINADATTAAFSITLPTAVGNAGRSYTIKRVNGGNNSVTITTTSSQTIDGSVSYVLAVPNAVLEVYSDGSNWRSVIRNDQPINVKDYGAKGDGIADDTFAIQAAITAASVSSSHSKTVVLPRGNYKTTATLMVESTLGLRVMAYGAVLKPALSAATPAIELKTTSANWMLGRQTVIEGLEINNSNLGVGVGIYVNQAQEFYLHNIKIWYCETALKLGDTWYGSIGGNSLFIGNTVGVDIVSDEVNTIDLRNLKINAADALGGQTTIGIRTVAQIYLMKFSGLTIEGYDYGFVHSRQVFGVGIFKFEEVYFEAIATCAMDFSQKSNNASINVEMTNIHFAEDNKAAWIKMGSGTYTFRNSDFKNNRILVKNDSTYRINLNTDVHVSQIDFTNTQGPGLNDGLVTLNTGTEKFIDGDVYRYNNVGDYNVYPTSQNHLPSVIDSRPVIATSPYDANAMGKFYPMYTVSYRDQVFERNGVILKSPGGNYFRLTVDDGGTVTTVDVTSQKKGFAPSLVTYPAVEIGRREVRGSAYSNVAEGSSVQIREINNRKVTKTSGVIVDGATGFRAVGTTLQAVATTPGNTFFSPYFWDTDIEYFYCWQSTYWGWSGTGSAQATNIRAIGTLAQRPATPLVDFMRYYATNNTTRYTWNGSAWS